MSDKSSEEKSEDPSAQKLKKARERGDIARSQTFAMVAGTIGGFAAFWMIEGRIGEWLSNFMSNLIAMETLHPAQALIAARDVLIQASAPVFLGAVVSSLLGNFFTNKGLIFSMEKIKPKIENLGFSSYRQRTFSMQGLSNFLQILFVFVFLFILMFLLIFLFRREFFKIFQCGLDCGFDFFYILFGIFIAIGLSVTLVVALVDLKVQSLIYLKQQRSTKTEAKKELKEEMGEPHIRQERKRLHEQAATSEPLESKLRRTSFILHHRGLLAVAIGYTSVDGRNQFFLVESARALKAENLILTARQQDKLLMETSKDTLLALLVLDVDREIEDPGLLLELSKTILDASQRP